MARATTVNRAAAAAAGWTATAIVGRPNPQSPVMQYGQCARWPAVDTGAGASLLAAPTATSRMPCGVQTSLHIVLPPAGAKACDSEGSSAIASKAHSASQAMGRRRWRKAFTAAV